MPANRGGLYGYYDLFEAISDPRHEDHEHLREWLGEGFDPGAFSLDEVNRKLSGRARPAS